MSRRFLLGLLAPFTVLVLIGGGVASASHTTNQLDVCCAWNGSLNDSDNDGLADLTYSISGGDAVDQATVEAAVEAWETALAGYGFELNKVAAGSGENFKIRLQSGGGVVAGSARRSFDKQGFVKSVDLKVTLKSFGIASDQEKIGEITRHESGHALGVNHADFDDLMDATVGGANVISGCDVSGVVAAQHWKLVEGSTTPHKPHVTHVGC